jgi:hypothetical protein
MRCAVGLIVTIVLKDRIANGNAFVANVSSRIIVGGRNQFADYVLTLVTKRTTQCVVGTSTFHAGFSVDFDSTFQSVDRMLPETLV